MDLFARCAAGDSESWRSFQERFRPLLMYLVRAELSRAGPVREEDVEDGVSDVTEILLRDGGAKLRAYDGVSSPATWLRLFALTAVRNRLRRERRLPPPVSDDVLLERALGGGEDPAAGITAGEEAARLLAALDAIPPRDRILLRLTYAEGLPGRAAGRS